MYNTQIGETLNSRVEMVRKKSKMKINLEMIQENYIKNGEIPVKTTKRKKRQIEQKKRHKT